MNSILLSFKYFKILGRRKIALAPYCFFHTKPVQKVKGSLSRYSFKGIIVNSLPCHTGRGSGDEPLYEKSRKILAQMAEIKEMRTIKENTKCCGAGGGVKKAFPELALEIAKSRIEEAEETGAEYLVSICPFCN